MSEDRARYLRVVTLDDGQTVHNAFLDRDFREASRLKLHYYPETDSLYIDLAGKPGVEAREMGPGLVADFDAAGNIVGLDIDQASTKLDLSKDRDDRPTLRACGRLDAKGTPMTITLGVGHNRPRRRSPVYAITFDLDTETLEELYPTDSWRNAYSDIRKFLEDDGFEH